MVFVTSDPHGHRDQLVETLQAAGLVDHTESWSGADATLWVLGDLMDRGPDGIGTVDLVMRLQGEAAEAGGQVGVVLGNHEVLALGMHRFAARAVDGDQRVLSFILSWEANGGHLSRPAGDHRRAHRLDERPARDGRARRPSACCTPTPTPICEYGDSIDEINAADRPTSCTATTSTSGGTCCTG